ncbi:flagellar motor protein MotB [Paenibacillus pini]|uniref:Flagellar motor rotation protein MotB n=1 Tax=Paenibacillus pini JCM 16418 TaxID=1236976 RepID=W7YPF7_9BACL|nr:flagellar motor protein MotB [Paenibacillus pini]GAF10317.1 flagellar motor rotation protein MotB [Paenibacillus pini JCM 16418]
MRRRGRRRGSGKNDGMESRDRWLITYADLITLLLIFFVMMYAMSRLDTEKYKVVTESLQLTFKSGDSILEQGAGLTGDAAKNNHKNPDTTIKTPVIGEKTPEDTTSKPLTEREQAFRSQEQELQNLMKVISAYVKDNRLENQIFVADEPQGIAITLSDKFLFDIGKADLKPISEPALDKLASLFKELKTTISIEGHTDNVPITHASKYKDNWDLSGARALSILRFFLDQKKLNPAEFQYAGYADTRPVGDNTTELGKQKNRRVEIIVLRQLHD